MTHSRSAYITIIIVSILLVPFFAMAGESKSGDDKVLAKINDYTLTTADFDAETQGKIPAGLTGQDLEKAKVGLLDDLITKKLLIQEAQKQHFDKDKAFIKEIERYWEQALLKLLYNKRSQDLLREISLTESDPKIREVKVQQDLNAWIADLKKRADIKRYEENLRSIRQ